jgi:HEAT repeat protein
MQRWSDLRRRSTTFISAALVATLLWHARAAPGDGVFDIDTQEAKLATISKNGADAETLRGLLRDSDPVIGAAAFYALAQRGRPAAVQALVAVVKDTTEPVRLQALQLLINASDKGDTAVLGALRTALNDPDSALVVSAVQTLMARDDPEARSALTDALREGSVASRLLIVRSIAGGDATQSYLYYALRDPDESVRSAAAAALSRGSRSDESRDSSSDEDSEP